MLLVCVLGLVATATAHGPVPSGRVSIATTSIVAENGVNWGDGVLIARGNRYTFAIEGLEVGDVDVSEVRVIGQVYHLVRLADFEGTYVAVEAEAAVKGRAGVLTIRNRHGVDIDLHSVQQGVKLSTGGKGPERFVPRIRALANAPITHA
jgi:hypothetical protein